MLEKICNTASVQVIAVREQYVLYVCDRHANHCGPTCAGIMGCKAQTGTCTSLPGALYNGLKNGGKHPNSLLEHHRYISCWPPSKKITQI